MSILLLQPDLKNTDVDLGQNATWINLLALPWRVLTIVERRLVAPLVNEQPDCKCI
jgi:hypothetical protein